MHKKIIFACVALVAFAAFPALANALSLRESGGTLVAVGSGITGTNEGNLVFKGSFGEVTCSTSTLSGKVTKNVAGGTEAEGEITSASFTGTGVGGKCTSAFFGETTVTIQELPWCLRTTEKMADKAELHGGACGKTGNLKFTLDGASLTCTYTASSITSLAYETTVVPGTIKFENAAFTSSTGGLCPTTGSFTGAYTLETTGTTTGIGIFDN